MSLIKGERGSVLFSNKHTTHTTVRTSDEHIIYRTEHTTHREQIIGYYSSTTQSTLSTDAHIIVFYVLFQR